MAACLLSQSARLLGSLKTWLSALPTSRRSRSQAAPCPGTCPSRHTQDNMRSTISTVQSCSMQSRRSGTELNGCIVGMVIGIWFCSAMNRQRRMVHSFLGGTSAGPTFRQWSSRPEKITGFSVTLTSSLVNRPRRRNSWNCRYEYGEMTSKYQVRWRMAVVSPPAVAIANDDDRCELSQNSSPGKAAGTSSQYHSSARLHEAKPCILIRRTVMQLTDVDVIYAKTRMPTIRGTDGGDITWVGGGGASIWIAVEFGAAFLRWYSSETL